MYKCMYVVCLYACLYVVCMYVCIYVCMYDACMYIVRAFELSATISHHSDSIQSILRYIYLGLGYFVAPGHTFQKAATDGC
jgi:hypothetical protein